MSDDIAIKVDSVYKDFKLPHQKVNSVKSMFTGFYKKKAKTFEVQHALKDISFEVKKGEFFGIVGRNGSGKSTLLKIIAEIYQPTRGSLQKSGKLVPFIELGVGFNPELTGRENVYLNGALLGFSSDEINAMYEDIVEFAELEESMDQKLKNYSSGMQVRLAFSVATRAKADILLIDEVLAVGDADFQRKCFNYFKSLKKSDTTVIFVSHDMDAVREYCDRAVLIDNNEIVEAGLPDKIAQYYVRLFTDESSGHSEGESENETRWGKGGISTKALKAKADSKTITINQTVQSSSVLEDPIIGVRIRSLAGENVTGSNTKIEKIKVGKISEGDSRDLVWEIQNVLADGTYYIDVAVMDADNVTVYDWWDEAATVTVKKDRQIPYIVDPNIKLTITV